tara:strand:- start:173958 stop:174587 length:630 start_codon:yes stop_codon:yes gene_type:complete
MSVFRAINVSISIKDKSLFQNLSFEVKPGEVLAVMGASGSGKSSLLSYIVGSLAPTIQASGELYLEDKRIDLLEISKRKVGILYQDDLLFPHFSVGENLLFGMKEPRERLARKLIIEKSLKDAGLVNFFDRMPSTLSGGQRSRVSVLRAVLSNPELILLDEPFSKLDKSLRVNFRDLVFMEMKQRAIPCIIVTHDVEDVPVDSHKVLIE